MAYHEMYLYPVLPAASLLLLLLLQDVIFTPLCHFAETLNVLNTELVDKTNPIRSDSRGSDRNTERMEACGKR